MTVIEDIEMIVKKNIIIFLILTSLIKIYYNFVNFWCRIYNNFYQMKKTILFLLVLSMISYRYFTNEENFQSRSVYMSESDSVCNGFEPILSDGIRLIFKIDGNETRVA